MRNLLSSIAMAAVVSVALLPAAASALEDKGFFSCAGEANGEYVNPSDCTSTVVCTKGKKDIKPCPEGQVINTSKQPPWKCETPEEAGMGLDCKRVPPPGVKKHGK